MTDDRGRLRWMCRRGMLELDILFERFIDRDGYAQLDQNERQLFEALLQEPDPVLFSWLLGFEKADQRFAGLVQKIAALSEK